MTRDLNFIQTKDKEGKFNGFVIPIAHIDKKDDVEQVYLTAIYPKFMKGPHLHLKRTGRFTCIYGSALIVLKRGDFYSEYMCSPATGYKTIFVPAGIPCALYNVGKTDALVLNMPSPPWRADDQDEHDVTDWSYDLKAEHPELIFP